MTDPTTEEHAQAFVEQNDWPTAFAQALKPSFVGELLTDAVGHIKALLAVNAKLHERLAALEAARQPFVELAESLRGLVPDQTPPHGGRRAGAGRKPSGIVDYRVRMTREDAEMLRAWGGGDVSAGLRWLLRAAAPIIARPPPGCLPIAPPPPALPSPQPPPQP